jgi:hypothetical protein
VALCVFLDLGFDDWARDEGVGDAVLCAAAAEIERGLVDARLGGFLVKKRVAAPGRGKRGGYRTIAAYRHGDRLVFLHGFAKNEKEDISRDERKALVKLGDHYMKYSSAALSELITKRLLVEVECDEQDPEERP